MANLNIVLVEPQIPQNTGNISRTAAVTGARLHLIGPLGFEISDRQLKRAGLDYWSELDVSSYGSLEDFFSKQDKDCENFFFSTKGKNTHSDANFPDNAYLFFGREDKGLPEALLARNMERTLRIPMRSELRSLNLSNSVAIAVYEVLRQWGYPNLAREGKLTGL